ncbi:MAG TPA: SDR family oxidoreductase [Mycobacteriales bacterium]|jgi:NAD(P)H dehydrogenase (quinone)|nr:SDR family oxidoreductase [Mycobacteriales bacterium]
MSIVVTGATGHLGRLVVEELLARGVPADEIVAAGRSTDKISDLAERGVRVRVIDFEDPATLRAAFAGADKVLLVSGSEVGRRVAQHRNAIEAAKDAGVGLLVYTGIANADRTSMQLAAEHQATEEALRASGVPFVLLRNGWYLENYTEQIPTYLRYGAVLGSAGEGRVSAATRADYAGAAAAVLTAEGQEGRVYELGGDEAFTLAEVAAQVAAASGKDVVYRDLPVAEYAQVLVGAGLPEPMAAVLADSDRGVAAGDLFVGSGDLGRLLGRPTTSLADAVGAALR